MDTTPKNTDDLTTRLAWCLRCYKNALAQGRPVATHVEATAVASLMEVDARALAAQRTNAQFDEVFRGP